MDEMMNSPMTEQGYSKRPQLGEWRNFTATAEKYRRVDSSGSYRRVRGEWRRKQFGAGGRGMFVGYRTVQEGVLEYIDDEVGRVMVADTWREMWLFVTGPRCNPVYVFPDDVATAESEE